MRKYLWFFLLAAICAAYAGINLNRGWVAHDDGALAQSAERVLHGELPHRDFDEIYGGLLDYFHAAAFAIFGIKLLSIRFVLFFFFLCWLPAVYAIALRFVTPLAAASTMALAAVWSIPFYPASMPSWYNLFFATFACWLLFRFVESGRKFWIFAAGLCCGVSILIKITGIYAVAAALLVLVHYEQDVVAALPSIRWRWPRRYTWFVFISLAVFEIVILRILGRHLSVNFLFAFLLPISVLVLYLIARALLTETTNPDLGRFRTLIGMILPLLAGVFLPIALYLLPYLASNSSRSLYEGLFEAPLRRLEFTIYAPGDPVQSWAALVLLAAILAALYLRERAWQTFFFFAAATYLFFETAHHPMANPPVWDAFVFLLPYAALLIVAYMCWSGNASQKHDFTKIFSILAFAVCCNLVRYPFDAGVYLPYVMPLIILAVTAASRLTPRRSLGMLSVLMLFVSAFAVFRHNPTHNLMPLGVDRGREILVPADTAKQYQRIMKLIGNHSHTQYIYAGPDAPDIYFLSGKTNPTRTLFDFLDLKSGQQALNALRERPIDVVVIRLTPQFSPPLGREVRSYIESNFPSSERLETFEVRWK